VAAITRDHIRGATSAATPASFPDGNL
jgi:hypothetical protein